MKNNDIPVVGPFLRFIFGSRNERFVKRYTSRADAVGALEAQVRVLTDAELRAKTAEFRERTAKGEKAVDMMIEAFSIAREAMDRSVGIRNIFNPRHADEFDPSQLPEPVQKLYHETKAKMDAMDPAPPIGPFLGCTEEQPGWRQVDIPNEIYEAVRELYPKSKPPFRARPFDVQLIGAMVLYQGKIAEMKTGEGKTIVAPLACYLAALDGLACHVVTVNDYLVQRDRDWTFPFFHALGLTVGAIHPQHMQPEEVKRAMYQCDVVYGTTSEFGFDYLRDNMKRGVEQQVQRVREFAVVDEVDSTLIDEARTPLIISGQAYDDAPRYGLADELARHLFDKQKPWASADEKVQACMKRAKGLEGDIRNARDKAAIPEMQRQLDEAKSQLPGLERDRDQYIQYYEVEMDKKQGRLTHHGIEEAQRVANVGSFYVGANTDIPHLLEQSIRAHAVYKLDRDYIIMPQQNPQTGQSEPGIVIVDTNTGRPMIGRQWSDGLHQAIEAKENVPIKQETQTVATITIQNYFKMYKRLAGMTGTADTEAQEFHDIYGLDVVVIPTNVPVLRADHNDLVYLTAKDKWSSIVDEIKQFHDVGRPVLVGTTSVERSEMLSDMLSKRHNIQHEVLNAKQHEREANIIESAGQLGAVMIATNMAGRGTDIKLARISRDELLDHWKRRGLAPKELTTDATDEEVRELIYRKIGAKELGMQKREAEQMPFEELELALLRHWASGHTWADPKKLNQLSADDLRNELDAQGSFMLHRIGWSDSVVDLGGLHVVGTERHESRRIDNQLRGRSGRQGDAGSSRFFVSLEDDLMKMFAGETTMKILSRLGMKEGDAIEHPMLTKSVERAQRKVEERNFQVRKNILEYDEVMEHQRQAFYGLRQRVLEGREMKDLIFDYIDSTIGTAVDRYLDRDYPAECIAERIRQDHDISIPVERLRNIDADDIQNRIRQVARDEAEAMCSVTVGEYMPAEEEDVEHDLVGLANWASQEFKREFKPSDLRGLSRREVENMLLEASQEWLAALDFTGALEYLAPDYGARQLAEWAKQKFDVEIDIARIAEAETNDEVIDLIAESASNKYRDREIEYPVTFAMDMTMAQMRQSPQAAAEQLISWANRRYQMGWDEAIIRTKMPQQIREDLLKASREFVEGGKLDELVGEALACIDDDALASFLKDRFDAPLPPGIEKLEGGEREDMIRARIEGLLRSEMIQFERMVLVDVLDGSWKEHLRAMDQVRDSIGFRSFSQQDPRIEFKREGSRLFDEMQETIRDRTTEFVFKYRLAPQALMAGAAQPGAAQRAPAPGNGAPPAPPQQPQEAPPTARTHTPAAPEGRDRFAGAQPAARPGQSTGVATAASQGAPGGERTAPEKPARVRQATQASAPRVGRNDPCPCGSGLKYKKCCGRNEAG